MFNLFIILILHSYNTYVLANDFEEEQSIYNIAYAPNEIGDSKPSGRNSLNVPQARMVKTHTDVGMSANEIADKICKNSAQENIFFLSSDEVKNSVPAEIRQMSIKFNHSSSFLNSCKQGFMDGYSAYLRESKNKISSQMDLEGYLKHLQNDPAIEKSRELCHEKYDLRKLDTSMPVAKLNQAYLNLDTRHQSCLRGAQFQNSTEVLRLINELQKAVDEETKQLK